MLQVFIQTFVALFVVIDPIGCAPIFAGLTREADPRQAAAMALRSCLIAGVILLGFATGGNSLLNTLHIELDSFRVAGGLMLFLIALDMVFEKRTQRREQRAESTRTGSIGHEPDDISVFPMAMPMIAGPGSIATVMLIMAHATGSMNRLITLLALGAVLAATLGALLAAKPLMRLLGTKVEAALTRVLGVLVGALAVQYVVDGIKGLFS